MSNTRRMRHLVIWAAEPDERIMDFPLMDQVLTPVVRAMTSVEGVVSVRHDLDGESVCFALLVDIYDAGSGEDALAKVRLTARQCLRTCLRDAGLLDAGLRIGQTAFPPVRLRLDPMPLRLHRVNEGAVPIEVSG